MTGGAQSPNMLMTALEAANSEQCVEILAGDATNVDPASWTSEELDRLRWTLVAHRDSGHPREALSALVSAARLWPSEQSFVIECFVLLEQRSVINDLQAAELAVRTAPEVLEHPAVKLFLALREAQDGGLQATAAFDALSAPERTGAVDPFARQMAELGEFALLSPELTTPRDFTTKQGADRFSRQLAWRFLALDRAGSLDDQVRRIAFENTLGAPHPVSRVLEALKSVYSRLSLEGQTTVIHLLVSVGELDDARSRILAGINAGQHLRSLFFAKAASLYAMRANDTVLERRILTTIPSLPAEASDLDKARHLEVMQRRKAISADRPLSIFVGFFGQCRAPEDILRATIRRLQGDFGRAQEGPFELHFGLSTWKISGVRALELSHPTDFFREILPDTLQTIIEPRLGRLGLDLHDHLPNTVDACKLFTSEQASRDITPNTLNDLFPPGSVVIDDETIIEGDVRKSAGLPDQTPAPHINQFKMWSRIAGLQKAVEQHEQRMEQRMDVCIFLRSDLVYRDGALPALASRVARPHENDAVFCDQDWHAQFIEGAGDRCLVASRTGANALFQCYDYLLDATSNDSSHAAARHRFGAHQALQAYLYGRGFSVMPTFTTDAEIYRPKMPLQRAISALTADADRTQDSVLRSHITQIINTQGQKA